MSTAAGSEPAIAVRGLRRRFGAVTALAGIDLEIAPGEVVALLGPNGAGKSTLLRILGTIVSPDEGTASVCGVDVTSEPARVRRLLGTMIGDERSLYWRLSGRRNLAFFCALHGIAGAAAKTEVDRLLELVDLVDAADRPVRGYSSGMRVRLSLARALIGSPAVLLLDEPTGGLDPIAAGGFRELAGGLSADGDRAILLATHDLREAVAVAGRIVALSQGEIVLSEATAGLDADRLEAQFREVVATNEGPPTGPGL